MHSEAIGSVWTFSKNFEMFWFLSRFSTFPDVIFTKDIFHGTIGRIFRKDVRRILFRSFIRKQLVPIGSVWKFSKIFEIFWIFESFFNVSGRNFYKRLFSRHDMQGGPK